MFSAYEMPPVQSSVVWKIPAQNMFSCVLDYKVTPASQVME